LATSPACRSRRGFLADRPAGHHEPAAGLELEHLRDGLQSKRTTRLTDTAAIDTAPSYSPDGTRICFESDRGGKPQIYVMGATGGAAQRVSFGEGSYSTPVWSPRGTFIAFTKQGGGQFSIGIMRPDGKDERLLTSGYHNEGPTFAPNGRVVMFFRDPGGTPAPRCSLSTSPPERGRKSRLRPMHPTCLVAAAVVTEGSGVDGPKELRPPTSRRVTTH